MNPVGATLFAVVLSILSWVALLRTYVRRWVPASHKRAGTFSALMCSVGASVAILGILLGEPGPDRPGILLAIGVPLVVVGAVWLTWTGYRKNGTSAGGSSSVTT